MHKEKKLNNQELQQIAGGYSSKDCLKDIGKGIGAGTVAGAAGGGLAAGLGAIPGAFVGAHFGVIGGSAACIGGLLGNQEVILMKKELLNKNEMSKIIGGKINWGNVGGSCVGGAVKW